MPNYKMAQAGHNFSEGKVNLSWGIGREVSDVISLPIKEQSARFKQRVLAGVIVETKDPVTDSGNYSDIREYRLMTGEEAAAHKAIPAGPVTRTVYNPVSGELVEAEIKAPRELKAAILAEEAKAAQPPAEVPDDDEDDEVPADPALAEADA